MLTLLGEAKFWSARADEVAIKCTDFGAFRYHAHKREPAAAGVAVAAGAHSAISDPAYVAGKRDYAQRRGQLVQLTNKRRVVGAAATNATDGKLRAGVQRLEEALRAHPVVHCRWQDAGIVQLMLGNGLLIHVCVQQATGDVQRLAFDKFFVGKLVTEAGGMVTDAVFTRMHILIAYSLNQITFVHLQKPSMRRSAPEKIARMDPRIVNILINGPPSRNLPRRLACNGSGDLLTVWTQSSQNEVYPWRPTVRDQDRANLNVYRISRAKLEPICYYWTEHDPCSVEFSAVNQNRLHSVEQNVSRKGDVTVQICLYEIRKARLQRLSVTAIPLPAQVCCHAFSPDNEKLLLGCRDGSTVIFDEARGITHMVRAAFVPSTVSWHCDSALVAIGSERGQLQCFDISLACVRTQLLGDDASQSATVLDLSGYLVASAAGLPRQLGRIAWNRKQDVAVHAERYAQSDSLLLALFAGGPAVCVRLCGTAGMRGDVHGGGLTADVLVQQYLGVRQVERAINVLLCMNWDTYGQSCMVALHKIANYVLRLPLVPEREAQLQKALGSFLVPVKPLCEETETDYGEPVRDLTRKFFQYLLRFRSFEKAFSLAIDINDEDLFMDLHNCAKADGHLDLAGDAYRKAAEIIAHKAEDDGDDDDDDDDDDEDDERDANGNHAHHDDDATSDCSHSSCSECGHDAAALNGRAKPHGLHNTHRASSNRPAPSNGRSVDYPPLPVFHPSVSSASAAHPYVPPLPSLPANRPNKHVRCNIPKLGLKVSAYSRRHAERPTAVGGTRQYHTSAANLTADNVLLVDPPLPQLLHHHHDQHQQEQHQPLHHHQRPTRLHRRTASQDNLLNLDVLPKMHPHHPSAMASYAAADHRRSNGTKPQPQQHMVIDVVPRPASVAAAVAAAASSSATVTAWQVPDQTLGIPFPVARHPQHSYYTQFVHQPQLPFVGGLRAAHSMHNIHSSSPPPMTTHALPGRTVHHQHPLMLATIPHPSPSPAPQASSAAHPSVSAGHNTTKRYANAQQQQQQQQHTVSSILSTQRPRDAGTERNKVKFSDTVTVATVPVDCAPQRVEKQNATTAANVVSSAMNNGGGHQQQQQPKKQLLMQMMRRTNPQQELADSLPLCHPNDDYLKDFQPVVVANGAATTVSTDADCNGNNSGESNGATAGAGGSIKVVHFGVI